jgi:hypothetical protein
METKFQKLWLLVHIAIVLLFLFWASVRSVFAYMILEAPEPFPRVVGTEWVNTPRLYADGLELYFVSNRPDGYGGTDIYVSKRGSLDDPFGEPENLGPIVNSGYRERSPSLSSDGLTLCFTRFQVGIFFSQRETIDSPWQEPVFLEGLPVCSGSNLSSDSLSLYFRSTQIGDDHYGSTDIYVMQRVEPNALWGEPQNLGPGVNSSEDEMDPFVTQDELILLFVSTHSEGAGGEDLLIASRRDKSEPFGNPQYLGPLINTLDNDTEGCISPDGQWLLFVRNKQLLQARIMPVKMFPDLNSDFLINFKDLSILAQNMESESEIYDISPPPLGDGVVNTIDLASLVYCWLKGSQARNPSPSDGATEVSPGTELNWTAGFDAVSYDIYFGTSDPPPFINNQIETTFNPFMSYETTYYWHIDEVSGYQTVTGNTWSFTTIMPPPPPPPQ